MLGLIAGLLSEGGRESGIDVVDGARSRHRVPLGGSSETTKSLLLLLRVLAAEDGPERPCRRVAFVSAMRGLSAAPT